MQIQRDAGLHSASGVVQKKHLLAQVKYTNIQLLYCWFSQDLFMFEHVEGYFHLPLYLHLAFRLSD